MARILNVLPWRRNRLEQDLGRELQYHIDRRVSDLRQSGLSDGEAQRQAAIEFGGVAQVEEEVRDTWVWRWLDDLARDVSYGLRMFRRSPVFTIVAILTLTLGIVANIAIFTIVSRVILRPLGYVAPEQLVSLTGQFMNQEGGLAAPEYAELRSIYRSLSGIGAFTLGEANLSAADRPRRVRMAQVDDHLLAVLGLRVAQGRVFTASETNSTGPQPPTIALLSHELWQSAFGARTIVGQTVNIDGRPHEFIGFIHD
jgi:hypothetical protein